MIRPCYMYISKVMVDYQSSSGIIRLLKQMSSYMLFSNLKIKSLFKVILKCATKYTVFRKESRKF